MKEEKEPKSQKKLLLLLLLLLFLIGGGIGAYLIWGNNGEDDGTNSETSEAATNDDSRVVSKNIDFSIDDMDHLQIVADITLEDELLSTEYISMMVYAYDEDDNLLHTYEAATTPLDIDGETEIHSAFDDNDIEDALQISYLETEVNIKERVIEPRYEYEYVTIDNPEVVEFVSMYRVFMYLSQEFHDNSGIAVREYEDGTRILQRVDYLDDEDFIGTSSMEDFTYLNGSKLSKVYAYKIAYLIEKN